MNKPSDKQSARGPTASAGTAKGVAGRGRAAGTGGGKLGAGKSGSIKPPAVKPSATKPSATKPSATKPSATKPSATKPSATKPSAAKPAAKPATKPADRKPVVDGSASRARPSAERGRAAPAWSNVVVSRDEQFRLKRNALLREAARAFSGRGYHNTSLDDVAAVLGVTKAALYHYVSSKQEILFECHMMSLDLGDEALDHARRHGRNGLERVSLLARRYIELITGEMGRFAVLSEYDALDSASRAVVGRRRDQFEAALREMMAEGARDGSIRGVDPKLAVFFLMGAINWMTRWFRPDGELSGADIAVGFSDLLCESLRDRS